MAVIIVDTSALYALMDRKDLHHAQAATFLKSQLEPGSLLVSNHVFDETMTTVKARLGTYYALQLGTRLRSSRLIAQVVFTAADETEIWNIFKQYSDKEWSYTDCSCLVLARQHATDRVFAFDHHFVQMGLVRVP